MVVTKSQLPANIRKVNTWGLKLQNELLIHKLEYICKYVLDLFLKMNKIGKKNCLQKCTHVSSYVKESYRVRNVSDREPA